MKNISPWIHQLSLDRATIKLGKDFDIDIAIIGGGIAGIATAFFVLRNTDKKVILLEGGRLGHGATGHNGGQLTSYFARSLSSLVKDFGTQMTIDAQRNIEEDAWKLLDIMYTEGGLDIPFSRFTGSLGLSNKEHLFSLIEDNQIRKRAGLSPKEILVADQVDFVNELEEKYSGLYELRPQSEILERLETNNSEFIACLSEQKGCLNSALFTEEIAEYLLKTYPERFHIFEHSHVNKVVLHENNAILDVGDYTVTADRVVLCTNGFDTVTIFNKSGLDIDTRFHHTIFGKIGYMSGYLEEPGKPPAAISYFTDPDASSDDPYFYLTRRLFEHGGNNHNLISVGGPETDLEDRKTYAIEHEYPERARDEINVFVKSVYDNEEEKEIDYIFTWHGLMGYTESKVRLIGVEPKNPILLYNLGCNGVGLLPSIFGGEKIAKILLGESLPPSIFDPRVD